MSLLQNTAKLGITRNWPEKNALLRGVLGPQAKYGHAVDSVSKFIPIETYMQNLITILQTATEHEPVKGRHAIDFFLATGPA